MKDDDGWIEWRGGWCPVPDGTLVDLEFRGGEEVLGTNSQFRWRHVGGPYDIVAYRISAPAEPPKPDTSAEENRLWHEYVGNALTGVGYAKSKAEWAVECADMADAMLAEARKLGRV